LNKKHLFAVVSIIVFLVVFLPLASSSPDGLEKVALSFGAQEHENIWAGLMADYTIASTSNSYVSTLMAGIFGIFIVLLTGLLLSKAISPKTKKNQISS
jgi:ABC-type sulfate transport system permease component